MSGAYIVSVSSEFDIFALMPIQTPVLETVGIVYNRLPPWIKSI